MSQSHILIVEDDTLFSQTVAFILEDAGYEVSSAASAEDALVMCRHHPPDLVLLDVGLPGMDGLEALPYLRYNIGVPVIFLTGRTQCPDEALCLQMGADDYITKPFDHNVLLARIKAVLRRTQPVMAGIMTAGDPPPDTPIELDDLVIDPAAHTVTVAGQPVKLSPREFALLHALAMNAGHVQSIDDLLEHVWGVQYKGQQQVVYVHIRWLRKKLEKNPDKPRRIITVRGVGYKLI